MKYPSESNAAPLLSINRGYDVRPIQDEIYDSTAVLFSLPAGRMT